jgi:hypothetical protein
MGRTKGGLNTKLAMIVDALGRPMAFDSDKLRGALAAHGISAGVLLTAPTAPTIICGIRPCIFRPIQNLPSHLRPLSKTRHSILIHGHYRLSLSLA